MKNCSGKISKVLYWELLSIFSGESEDLEAANAFAKDQVMRVNQVLAHLPQLNEQPILELAEVNKYQNI